MFDCPASTQRSPTKIGPTGPARSPFFLGRDGDRVRAAGRHADELAIDELGACTGAGHHHIDPSIRDLGVLVGLVEGDGNLSAVVRVALEHLIRGRRRDLHALHRPMAGRGNGFLARPATCARPVGTAESIKQATAGKRTKAPSLIGPWAKGSGRVLGIVVSSPESKALARPGTTSRPAGEGLQAEIGSIALILQGATKRRKGVDEAVRRRLDLSDQALARIGRAPARMIS